MFSFIFLNNISNKYVHKTIENYRNERECNKILRIRKVPNQTPTNTFHIKVSLGCPLRIPGHSLCCQNIFTVHFGYFGEFFDCDFTMTSQYSQQRDAFVIVH